MKKMTAQILFVLFMVSAVFAGAGVFRPPMSVMTAGFNGAPTTGGGLPATPSFTSITTSGASNMGQTSINGLNVSNYLVSNGAIIYTRGAKASTYITNDNGTDPVSVNDAEGFHIAPKSLATCAASLEGTMVVDILSGVATGKRTKMCLCTSNGASVYVWQNLATGTLGSATTCGTE